MMEAQQVTHPFPPLFDAESRILILGSFPSIKSREQMFFYGHPQNRFWKVIAAVYGEEVPTEIPQKKELILRNHLALWDTVGSCEIVGSSDASIRNVKANDLSVILDHSRVERIFCNGKTSHALYRRYLEPVLLRPAECLPSTSPANAQWSLSALTEAWKTALTGLDTVSEKISSQPQRNHLPGSVNPLKFLAYAAISDSRTEKDC